MLATIKEAWKIVQKRKKKDAELREMARIARVFNNRYTYRREYTKDLPRLPGDAFGGLNPRGGYAWMCPECNAIHYPKESSVFSGLQYPKCCSQFEGHRLDCGIATGG